MSDLNDIKFPVYVVQAMLCESGIDTQNMNNNLIYLFNKQKWIKNIF